MTRAQHGPTAAVLVLLHALSLLTNVRLECMETIDNTNLIVYSVAIAESQLPAQLFWRAYPGG